MKVISRNDVERLKHLPIEQVAARLGLKVTKHRCLCPYHADSRPSLSFHTRWNVFKCWSCDAKGGVIDLAMHVLNKNFRETCLWLADNHNIYLPDESATPPQKKVPAFEATQYERYFARPYLNNEARKFLFEERRLDERVVKWCRLNSWTDRTGVCWLQTPYYTQERVLTGVQLRRITPRHEVPRFLFPPGCECHIYNRPVLNLLQPHEPLYITEGCSDCWAMLSAGHKAIAIPSATLLKPEDLQSIGKRDLHIYPDKDEAGEKLYRQLVQVANQLGASLTRHELPEGCKDFADYWKQKKSYYLKTEKNEN